MRKKFSQIGSLAIAAALAVFLFSTEVKAHPGNTASDGCHYCRTNCSKWGEVSGARHCHGGYVAPAPIKPPPPKYAPPPPSPKPSPYIKRSSPSPVVKGATKDITSSNDNILSYGIIGLLIAWIYKLKNEKK